MPAKYRALAVDLDGTLLNSRHEIDPETVQALQRLREAGVWLIGVTGRSWEEFHPMQHCFDHTRDWAIVQGGSMILQYQPGRILTDFCLIGPEDRRKMLKIGRQVGCPPLVYLGDKVYSEPQQNPYCQVYEEMMKHPLTYVEDLSVLLDGTPIGKISLMGEPERMRQADALMRAEGVSAVWGFSADFGIDLVGRSKRPALEQVLERLGVSREETVTVGDSDNDLEMIRFGGLGVAMANASPRLQQAAGWVTRDNDHNGVAYLIDSVILRQT